MPERPRCCRCWAYPEGVSGDSYDIIDGERRPGRVVVEDEVLDGTYQGSIRVGGGATLVVRGTHQGSLAIEAGGELNLAREGRHQGSLTVADGASATIRGRQQGSVHIAGEVIVEPGGRQAGSVYNTGRFYIAGEQGGTLEGPGEVEVAPTATIMKPVRRNGMNIYEWRD